ncbi:MAG: M20/M25/M40 family metallo-hydrolase [Deltaproteobacteria bacterium]|nr:M20/M25/M40 family metallo-hydrolase [Deltaproteobacteria bacterium]
MEFLKALTETPGVSGREEQVRDLIRERTEGWWDEIHEDRIGNLIGKIGAARRKRGVEEKAVVLACHLDQIGFYVRYIDDRGFLRLQHAGGFDTRNLFARRVRVLTKTRELLGILNPATKPIHVATPEERNKIPTMNDFVVDLGISAARVKKLVRPGDPVVLQQTTEELGDLVCGQAMDNRISPWVALNAIKKARGKNIYDIYFLGSAQEEVGVRGATVAAQQIEAELAIAIDVTLAVDTPGAKKEEAISRLGDGVAIKIMDGLSISTHTLVDEFVALAKRKKIKHQYEILPLGGTDAGALQRFGQSRRTITLSVPCRYVHTVVETVHKKDLKATVDLLAAWLMGA